MKLKALLMAGLMLLLSAVALAYDEHPGPFKEFPGTLPPDYQMYEEPRNFIDVSTSITQVRIIGTAEGLYPDYHKGELISRRGVGVFTQEGSGFYVGHGFFVTSAHVVVPHRVSIQVSRWLSFATKPVKIVTMQIFIGQNYGIGSCPGEIVHIDHERDLALLRVIGNWPALEDLEYRMGWTQEGEDSLYPGMAVAVIVAVRQNPPDDLSKSPWFEIRYGKVVDTHARVPGPMGEGHNLELALPWFSTGDVTTDIVVYPGDSGSPVFAFENGKPVIIGVARAAIDYYDLDGNHYYYSYFARIDVLIPFAIEK